MHLRNLISIAFKALRKNQMRALLTMLGIIIGVAAVIAMISIGQGASASMTEQINSMGTNIIFVNPGSSRTGGVFGGFGTQSTLTEADAKAITLEAPSVAAATPTVRTNAQLVYGNTNWNAPIQGANEQYAEISAWPVDGGVFYSKAQVDGAAKVAVLGSTVVQNLFNGDDPIGKVVRIKNIPFKVVGTLVSKGQQGAGADRDNTVVIPYTTLMKRMQRTPSIGNITVSAISAKAIDAAVQEIKDLLHDRHKIQPGMDDDFNIRTQQDIAQVATSVAKILTMLLASIAGVSLLVGGIGIMNIMLVSVTERTREIGIRLAVGAKESDIMSQFLIESIVLSLVGGLIGVALGVGSSWLITRLLSWRTVVPIWAVAMSFSCAAAVGIFFGYYPALKASRLDPIEALRSE